jgi:hypothetical protein
MSRRTVFRDGTLRWGCPVVRRLTSSGSEMIVAGRLLSATHFAMWALMYMSQRKVCIAHVLTRTQGLSVHDENTQRVFALDWRRH